MLACVCVLFAIWCRWPPCVLRPICFVANNIARLDWRIYTSPNMHAYIYVYFFIYTQRYLKIRIYDVSHYKKHILNHLVLARVIRFDSIVLPHHNIYTPNKAVAAVADQKKRKRTQCGTRAPFLDFSQPFASKTLLQVSM